MAEQKILSAEAQAVAEVRAIAADVAVAAAAQVLSDTIGRDKADVLIKDSIEGLKGKIH
jgi:F-type H+-transporting ATPase subunit b